MQKMGFGNIIYRDILAYCAFNASFGRYKFLSVPCGICSASEIFRKNVHEYFDDIEGVSDIDDIVNYAKDKKRMI